MKCGLASMLIAALLAAPAWAEVKLPRILSDHMVLQREQPVTIWGWASPGERVTVLFSRQDVSATADEKGNWSVKLAAMKANAIAQDLTVNGRNTVKVLDILVGDVWLCSGQSNMAFGLGGCNAAKDIETANFPQIRFLSYWECFAGSPRADITGPSWHRMDHNSAGGCTAVGFYFGRRIHRETKVPIGLVESTVGGTEIECWMPPEAFGDYPANAEIGRQLQEAVGQYRKSLPKALDALDQWVKDARKALAENAPLPPTPRLPGHPNEDREHWVRIQSLYNGMIAPLEPLAIKGAIWYQGESNGGEGDSYVEKKRALIETWRKRWGQEFPFYFVQLANFEKSSDNPAGGDGWAKCRMAQLECLKFPKTGMAVSIDVGEANDIHPKNKFDVGERLALWALAKDYGKKDLVCSGPLYKGMKVEDGKIRIEFDSIGGGLMAGRKDGRAPTVEVKDGKLKRFAIAGEDKKWVWADAVIAGKAVVVSSPEVPKPVAVRYAFSMNPEGCNLYNKEGLPASPFRTDAW